MFTFKIIEETSVQTNKNRLFFQKWTWFTFQLWAAMVEKWNFRNIVMLYAVRFQLFCWSKIQIEVLAKNENYKKKCHNYLEVWVQCNIIINLRGLEMTLAFVRLGSVCNMR